jgi:hypothetical protein
LTLLEFLSAIRTKISHSLGLVERSVIQDLPPMKAEIRFNLSRDLEIRGGEVRLVVRVDFPKEGT